jgi:ankyrin repeat protein
MIIAKKHDDCDERMPSFQRRRCIRTLAVLFTLPVTATLPSRGFAKAYDEFFRAVKMDFPDDVKSWLQRGLDPNLTESERGDTGLILALRENSMKVFDVLLKARHIDIEAKSKNGDTALMIAAFKENKPAVEALLAKGAEVNQPGWTALHYAAAVGNNEIVRILLDRSAYVDAESPNKTTPIMMAARGGHIYTVKLLLDEGADATLKNDLGMTAIDFARKYEHQDIVEGLTYRLRRAGLSQ